MAKTTPCYETAAKKRRTSIEMRPFVAHNEKLEVELAGELNGAARLRISSREDGGDH